MKSREDLLAALRAHSPFNEREAAMLARVIGFVAAHARCFERTLEAGHVTGSAWVVSPGRTHALLVHHRRLGKWLQPGGHCDGDADVLSTALRETLEETGLAARPLDERIFDVDAHDIPARASEPAHVHYDIRFLAGADMSHAIVVSPESRDVQWVALDRIALLDTDDSVLRLVEKTRRLIRSGY